MEVSGRGQGSKVYSKKILLCDLCTLLKKNEKARHYCIDCHEYFCDNCVSVHKVSKLSSSHTVLSNDAMPKQKLQLPDQNFCTNHTGKVLEYFCRNHNDFFCTLCVTLSHKECGIDHIDDIATDFDKSTEYTSLMDKISHLAQSLQKLKTLASKNYRDIQIIHGMFRSDVKKFRVEINNLLDYMENSILTVAEHVEKGDLEAIHSVFTTCENMETGVLELSSNMDFQKGYKQKRQLVISAKKAQTKVKQCESKMRQLYNRNKFRNYRFLPNADIIHSLQSVDSLGKILNEESRTKGDEEVSVTHDPKSVRAKCIGLINVQHTQDSRDCWITGIEMLDDNKIVLVDNNNICVKVVDLEHVKITSCINLLIDPWDITRTDGNRLVVTCENNLVFLQVEPTSTLTVNKVIEAYGKCRGIVFTDNKLVVTFVSPEPAIKIIGLSGEILRTFSQDTTGQPLFKWPSYITLSYDKSTLFVSDHEENKVTSLNLKGEVQHGYTHNTLKGPRGMTADRHGNIYIAGWGSNNIHQISTQCRPIHMLLDDTQGMEYPQSVTYCEIGNKLYTSNYAIPRNNVLSVYQLR